MAKQKLEEQYRTQKDKVIETLGEESSRMMKLITEKVYAPDIGNLHTKSFDEIAKVLTNILKSRANIVSLTYTAGQPIEITSESKVSNI